MSLLGEWMVVVVPVAPSGCLNSIVEMPFKLEDLFIIFKQEELFSVFNVCI
jgi:hypothetical protein